ncbi:hypothetical protein [Sediminicoccus rosea]|jgi:hypothetical protein|uniref:Uncharacterized protein n=1 Tax=Sediminicoccus rosea TaxID=1225128 RepID=A0ABZ0PQD1_9PROT|nr:hypothetical protein [Sediminicoccus rosea]WPB87381.1 hypothetical protein R9Z33_10960 [Sediminicoccus rosea]
MSPALLPLAAALAALAAAPAAAQSSSYTDLTGPNCRPVRGDEGTRECPGPAELGLRVNGDHAVDIVTLRLGRTVAQVSPPSIEGAGGVTGRVEWRLAEGRPYALILRRGLRDDDLRPRGSRLEVYRIGATSVCYLGEARGADENARARQIADAGRGTACP